MTKLDQIEAKLRNNKTLDHFSKHEIEALVQYARAAESYLNRDPQFGTAQQYDEYKHRLFTALQSARKVLGLEP